MTVAKKKHKHKAKTVKVGGLNLAAPAPGRKLYVAYGSNLHRKKMAERCPNAKPVGSIILTECKLVFRGVADLQHDVDGQVPVGLWDIDEKDEEALDRYEGYPTFYGKYEIDIKGTEHKALIYLMVDREGVQPPSAWYASIIADGYRHFELDLSYLREAIKHSYESKTPSEQTIARRRRQRNSTNQAKLVAMPREVMEQRTDDRLKQQAEAALYHPIPEVTLLDYAEEAEQPIKTAPKPANGSTFKRMTIDDYRRESARREREREAELEARDPNLAPPGKWTRRNLFDDDFNNRSR
jgi:hypothetical protein